MRFKLSKTNKNVSLNNNFGVANIVRDMYTGAIIMTLVFSYLFMEYGIHLRYRIDDLVLRCCVVVFIESYNNAVFNAVGKTTKRYIFFLFML